MVQTDSSWFSSGQIEVICGPMFSGKTEELIRRVRRAQIARQKVQIFKPGIDDRYHASNVVSHSALSVKAVAVKDSNDILNRLLDSTRIVAIDEVQFFDEGIIKVIKRMARRGCRVICSGLDQDFRGEPFGPIPQLLAVADRVDKVSAICTVCGASATKTYRIDSSVGEQVVVGETDVYEARCRSHFEYMDEEDEIYAFNGKVDKTDETVNRV